MKEDYYEKLSAVWAAMVADRVISPEWCKTMLDVANGLYLCEMEKAEDMEPVKEKKKMGRPQGAKKRIDWGKVGACYNAGWSAEKIADEVGASVLTIREGITARKWEERSET